MPDSAPQILIQALGPVIGCLTSRHLQVSASSQTADKQYVVEFPNPVSLRSPIGGPSGLFLDVTYVFDAVAAAPVRFRPRLEISTRMYEYRLLDHSHQELLVYHWHSGPGFRGPDQPHLHVSAALQARVDALSRREIGLDKLHVATGQVSLAAIVRMLITEFGIAPLRHDWRETLDRSERAQSEETGP